MESRLVRKAFLLLSFSLASCGHMKVAQEDSALYAQTPKIAAHSPGALLAELARQERELYILYNGLNSSDAFDVSCGELSAPSQPAHQICEAAFVHEIREQVIEELALESADRGKLITKLRNAFISSEKELEERVRERAREPIAKMQQEMEALAVTDAQLAATLTTIAQLQVAYLESVESSKSRDAYLMRQNDPGYSAFASSRRVTEPRPILSAPPPGHTQPRIHFPADRGLR